MSPYIIYKKDINEWFVDTGLLTVDPKKRITMQDLRNSEWIQGLNHKVYSSTPLVTPNQLSLKQSNPLTINSQISATMDAFHMAQRVGFLLQDVTKAPLAQRRQKKRSSESTSTRSSSSDSLMSQHSHGSATPTKSATPSPVMSSPNKNLSNSSQSSTTSTGFTPLFKKQQTTVKSKQDSGYFSFKQSHIKALLPTTFAPTSTGLMESSTIQTTSPMDSSTEISGTKRKLDSLVEENVCDSDDCVIVGEAGPSSKSRTPSDALNNNSSGKRQRIDTIVIE